MTRQTCWKNHPAPCHLTEYGRGLSDAAASRQAVGNPKLIANLRNRRSDAGQKHPVENIEALCRVLGLEFYIGPKRSSAPSSIGFAEAGSRFFGQQAESAEYPILTPYEEAGDDGVLADFAISRRYLSSQGLDVKKLRVLRVPEGEGDKELPPASVVVVNLDHDFEPCGTQCAYFMTRMGRVKISRLAVAGERTLVRTSDRTSLPEIFERPSGFKMIGPVVMMFRDFEGED